jgi:hypothetical protein
VIFSGLVDCEKRALLLVFLRGLQEFVVQKRGKSLVACGGLRGETWCLSATFLIAENLPTF